jgi:spoIIIJ-associated protein
MPETVEELKDKVRAFAEGFAISTGLEITCRVAKDEPESITMAFDGPDSRYLVGKAGQALDALQTLALNALVRRSSPRLHVIFDADFYRERREKLLVQMASQLADEVAASGQEAVLDPMSSLERRIVHNVLMEHGGVQTYSEGEEPNRCIVIAPK